MFFIDKKNVLKKAQILILAIWFLHYIIEDVKSEKSRFNNSTLKEVICI